MDEYALEIDSLKRTLERLRAEDADAALIEEYAAELRNLQSLYRATQETVAAGNDDHRLRRALEELGFGEWSLAHVYGFVYEAAMEAETQGRDLATIVDEIDFAKSLLAALDEPAR